MTGNSHGSGSDDENSGDVFADAQSNFLAPITDLLNDPTITEIMINGPQTIYIERGGKVFRAPNSFANETDLQAAVNNIAQSVDRRITTEHPTLDARLKNGSRVHAVLAPVARNGTTVAIRKFSKTKMDFENYVRIGAVTADAAQFLAIAVYLGKNIIVSGGTGSGKTTLLGVLSGKIPKGQRLIVIEDASELTIHYEHVVFFETRMANAEGKGEVSMRDLLKSSLRLRPDRIIVGEVRGSEALELISAMNTGHKGCMGTVHANNPEDALVRLEGLAMGGESKISTKAIQHQIGSAVEMVVQISRFPDGSRRIQSIAEVRGVEKDGTYVLNPIYELPHLQRGPDGKLHGFIQPTGNLPAFMEEIEANRIPFPRAKFAKVGQAS